MKTLIQGGTIVNEGVCFKGSIVMDDDTILEILPEDTCTAIACERVVDARGKYIIPGVIDEHVHFRDPGLTQKADMITESRAAVAGGVTSFMDMPNTVPQTTTLEALEQKWEEAARKSSINYSFYFGATNDNYPLFSQLDKQRVCGIKLFMGASTGNMLVDQEQSLNAIFGSTDLLIAAHCEDQQLIYEHLAAYKAKGMEDLPVEKHAELRDEEVCYSSSALAVQLATRHNARLHLLHVSTRKELELLSKQPLEKKKITAEVCVPHLLFTDADYGRQGARIKCNPAIKSAEHREALRQAVRDGRIDTIATDHAPHLLSEKQGGALKAVSGMPMIQFSLISMLELVQQGVFSMETMVEKMCHAPAKLYHIDRRGFIRKGYKADIVLIEPTDPWTLTSENIFSKCRWSPMEGHTFSWKVSQTYVNGVLVYDHGNIDEHYRGQALTFNR